ncbi:unnamed protein product, partial [Polarella glacialis]
VGALTETLVLELDTLLAETRHHAILESLEAWRGNPKRPREGVLALERMALAGPQPQSFDWPDLGYPATLSEVCGSLLSGPTEPAAQGLRPGVPSSSSTACERSSESSGQE